MKSGNAAIILLAVAIAVRVYALGNPVIQIDEQFYLLVGGRMLHGALPYVDIFDRKPIGLFLIYAFARLAGGSGVIAYQVLALLFAWGTALTLFGIARRIASPGSALAAAALYLVWLDLAGGEGGQAPVFYNLFMTLAAAILLARIGTAPAREGDLRVPGIAAMLLVGLALQVKYSVVFEGMFFGIMLLWSGWRGGRRTPLLAVDGLLWIGCAMAPTAAAIAYYAAIGHLDAWYYANVTSILDRGHEQPGTVALRIEVMAMLVAPLALAIPLRRWTGATPIDLRKRVDLRFVDGWAASALLGVVLFGTWFNHYALPLFGPFALAAAPLGARRWGRVYLGLLLLAGTMWGQRTLHRHTRTRGDGSVLAGAIRASGRFHGCAFVYDGLPAFYDATGSCLPTTRVFPAHLQSLNEAGATGIDQPAEVRRIMAARPPRVMTLEPSYDEENAASRAAVYRVLRTDYVAIFRRKLGDRTLLVYAPRGELSGLPSPRRR